MFGTWMVSTLRVAGWAPASVFGLHVVAARSFDAYTWFPELDMPMHLLGGAAIAFFFHVASLHGSRCQVLGPYHRLNHVALVFAFTCTAALLWEFAEFLADRYLGTRMQGGDLNDTLLDMLLGMVGGVVLLGLLGVSGRLPEKERVGGEVVREG